MQINLLNRNNNFLKVNVNLLITPLLLRYKEISFNYNREELLTYKYPLIFTN